MRVLNPILVAEHLSRADLIPTIRECAARCGVDPSRPRLADSLPGVDLVEPAFAWAKWAYPQAEPLRQASFAGLVGGLATGLYGGYGTEGYELEEQVQDLILALAAGRPSPREGVVAFSPPVARDGTLAMPLPCDELTPIALDLMVEAYFGRGIRAAMDRAARILDALPGDAESPAGLAREGLMETHEKWEN